MPLPLSKTVEIETADGRRYRWAHAAKMVSDRPAIGPFATQLGDGFGPSVVELSRRRDLDWPDVDQLSTIRYIADDGSIAYEGRIWGVPTSSGRRMRVETVGWATYLQQRPFTEIYVDRDPSNWGSMTLNHRLEEALANRVLDDHFTSEATGDSLRFSGTKDAITNNSRTILMYVLPTDNLAASFQCSGTDSNVGNVEAAKLFSTNDDTTDPATWEASSSITMDDTVQSKSLATPARFLMMRMSATSGHTPANPAHRTFKRVAVYGDHSVSLRSNLTAGDTSGVYASDVIEDVLTRFAPKVSLETPGSDYPIGHLIFPEPTTPYDAIIRANEFHHWNVGVFEGPTLRFEPVNLTTADWTVREDWPGVEVDMGEDSADFVNGVPVSYTDVTTGRTEVLWPDVNADLRDDSDLNPANAFGEQKWAETFSVPFACLAADALKLGAEQLLDLNTPRAPGTIRVPTKLKDTNGNWQPAWRPRCGDSVSVTTNANRSTHLITATSFDEESKTLEISTDYDVRTLDTFLARLEAARTGRISGG